MTGIEQYVRVRVCASGPDETETLPVLLRYDPATDPTRVGLGFPGTEGAHDHVFARALLEEGLRSPAETAALRIWPCGRAQTVLELRRAAGLLLVLQFDSSDLIRFLRRTYTAAAHYEAGLTGPVREAPRAPGRQSPVAPAGPVPPAGPVSPAAPVPPVSTRSRSSA
ncbi:MULTISPECIES: SsgA family sporulation/cell division regulator [Streptomyces]|uniref:SsgA family sporulation/cell division regulator n=2 Tax=Streptomyces TaxID=1883 RepID=A0ABU2R7A4_9ACTN|nr:MULTISPECIES: SsgA family sporulation/cell division regulator [unclassified Streptomyces]MDT0412584.1 SsgA family sporulation/cell division regulator [Streptomyces sp. DSM 41979]MYQ61525.1 SsgA family sporulation/cell division regulator [Streptomyces sp. SID4926]